MASVLEIISDVAQDVGDVLDPNEVIPDPWWEWGKDAIDSVTGGGGDGDAGGAATDPFTDYLDWVEAEQAKIELEAEREELTAEALTEFRRGELADRTGYAGTALVGDAAQRTDETLAEEMTALDPSDPTRQAYEAALAAEAETEEEMLRIISGEQFDIEDAEAKALAEAQARDEAHAAAGDPVLSIDPDDPRSALVFQRRGGTDRTPLPTPTRSVGDVMQTITDPALIPPTAVDVEADLDRTISDFTDRPFSFMGI